MIDIRRQKLVEKCIVMDPAKSYSSLTWNNSGNKADETKVTKLLVVVNSNIK